MSSSLPVYNITLVEGADYANLFTYCFVGGDEGWYSYGLRCARYN